MTWKMTAASSLLSLAAWSWWGVVAEPPVPEAAQAVARPNAAPPTPSDIEREAGKLQARLHPSVSYEPPARNPFSFGALAAAPRPRVAAPVATGAVASVADLPPVVQEVPRMSLAGVAADVVDGATIRSAILSTSSGVQIVKEGETLEPGYRVERIEDEAVELVAADGQTRRLVLGR
jgi:hypothetical protein